MEETAIFDERFCREKFPGACTVVIFGATGDLAARKLFPALQTLFHTKLLHPASRIVAVSRRQINANSLAPGIRNDAEFLQLVKFHSFSPDDPFSAKEFAAFLDRMDNSAAPLPRLYYLALPSPAYPDLINTMAQVGLFFEPDKKLFRNLVLEKPLGYDFSAMKKVRRVLKNHLEEHQIYLIDHYLGKDEVQNILLLRFANAIFSGVWNRKYIESITIGVCEHNGIGSRAGYFDRAGIVRDMFQSHLLLMLGLCMMRRPKEFSSSAINRSLANALSYVSAEKILYSGQYQSYRQEKNVPAHSNTLTCADILFKSSRCDWKGVTFRLYAGKKTAFDRTFIKVLFKREASDFFGRELSFNLPGNELALEIKPSSGISLALCSKKAGPHLCLGTLTLKYKAEHPGDGYSRLLLDCLNCDRTFFPDFKLQAITGKICDKLLDAPENNVVFYPDGTIPDNL